VPPQAVPDAPAGRGLARLDAVGPMRRCTAGAVRAAPRLGLARCAGHVAPTSRRVWGDAPWAETPARPVQRPSGSSKAKRPALQPCVLSILGVDRAGPMWGQPEEGHAADKPRQTTLGSESAPLRAH
jgi:hypothetical protein